MLSYRYWLDNYELPEKGEVSVEAIDGNDTSRALACPKCHKLMHKFWLDAGHQTRVDMCTSCDEVFLDSGEWELLQELDLVSAFPQVFTDQWQNNVRRTRNKQRVDEKYQQALGDEVFNQTKTFSSWLHEQPKKNLILEYLSRNS